MVAALLNALVLLSVPSEGGHYLVDIFAGLVVAGFAIAAAARVEQALGAVSVPIAAVP